MNKRPALFLDRDGVINIDHGYVYRQEDFQFINGIFELVALAKKLGFVIVIITNQAGIGRGYYTEEDFHKLMEWVTSQFEKHNGGIDKIYFCPDHPVHGIGVYHQDSKFRKPAPGMILQAVEELNIDLPHSILVGDKISDVKAGFSAGIEILFLLTNSEETEISKSIQHLEQVKNYLLSN